ncbi:putative secreted protein [Lentithecium fluviatile CBS 122367]|uniref:Putative secreted protein n=1 Tax=Lentithecium fluviatile CBS 122367 TaxID=1168545 RepID=A0A6G1IZ99_9PLEO|nr:putative secreted protein [Lentithecium fluviatile CBS 122367]
MFVSKLAFLATAMPFVKANLLNPLPPKAAAIDLKFQPVMDFDTDSCYNVAAIDADGNTNAGLDPSKYSTDDCRAEGQLWHSNAYSRHMCNRGWCAIIYAYYFEMDSVDVVVDNAGHTHDWEHVVVWVKDDAVQYVATSAHGDFDIHDASDVRFQDTHAKIVYHMDWKRTRNMRLAKSKDDDIENHTGEWFTAHLVGWTGFPSDDLREKLVNADFGSAHMQFRDSEAGGKIAESMPQAARDDEFDCAYDDGSQD